MKKAILHNGTAFHFNMLEKFSSYFDASLYLPDLKAIDEFDCVFLSSRLNNTLLKKNEKLFLSYLENGGNIVILGGLEQDFFSFIHYEKREVNFWWWIHQGADLPLFAFDEKDSFWKFLSLKECKWHYHGIFIPRKTCRRILVNELGEDILLKDEQSFKGALYLSALDPDFHIGQGFMPITLPFFEKFIQWIDFDLRKMQ